MSFNPRSQPEDVSIDLGAILAALWRAKRWIVPLVVVTAVGAFVGLGQIAPKYRGEAKLLIETRDLPLRESRVPEQDRAMLDQEGVASQVQVMSSRDLGRRVIAEERLGDAREFRKGGLLGDVLAAVGLGGGPSTASPDERNLDAYFERLQVFQIEKSRVIQVEFSAEDPDLAARVANAVVRTYLKTQGEAKLKNSVDASKWLDTEIIALRAKVSEAEAKVEAYRSGSELFVTTNNNTLAQQQLAELNSQLTVARGLKSDAEAKQQQLKKLVDTGGSLDGATEISSQPLFQRLRERQVALRSRIAEMSATYLPSHPQVQAINAQLRDIDGQIRAEVRRILGALENDVRVADQRIRELRTQLGEYKAQAARANEEDIQLRALEREAKAQRELLENYLARYREASALQNTDAQPADARIVSEASPPSRPYFPKVLPLTSVITLAVFLLAATFVVMRELLSGGALRVVPPAFAAPAAEVPPPPPPAQAAVPTAVDPLATLATFAVGGAPGARVATDPAAVWATIAATTPLPVVVAVVSAISAGTSSKAALALARSASTTPVQVCLVCVGADTDDMEPVVGVADAPGVRELLAGSSGFGSVIYRDRRSRLHVIPPGRGPAGPLDAAAFATALEALRQAYDHVVVDVGVLAGADPVLVELTAAADYVVVATAATVADPATEAVAAALGRHGAEAVTTLSVDASRSGRSALAA